MPRKGHPPEFRRKAPEFRRKVLDVARDLGISTQTIYNWRRFVSANRCELCMRTWIPDRRINLMPFWVDAMANGEADVLVHALNYVSRRSEPPPLLRGQAPPSTNAWWPAFGGRGGSFL